jgi:N-acyl-D-aspartate/D-glutamate deacylase
MDVHNKECGTEDPDEYSLYLEGARMLRCDTLIRNARVLDGTGKESDSLDVAIRNDRICEVGTSLDYDARESMDGDGLVLAPGFIDVHTHDDTAVIGTPAMLPKISQGVTTVIVGNCGISATPVALRGEPPDPMNLLGGAEDFRYPTFATYREQLQEALDGGALGLSSGLAYLSAYAASTKEILALAKPLEAAGAVYTTHMRTETDGILDAMR